MKKIYTLLLLVAIISLHGCKTNNAETKNNAASHIENPYHGQNPPGLTPIPFAPGLVSTEIYE